jgi:outer membrane protein TolC
LGDALRAATESSEESRLLVEKELRLRAQKHEVLAGALPMVQFYANAGRGASPFDLGSLGFEDSSGASVLNFAQSRYSYGIEVQQPIFSFGRVTQALKTAGRAERSQAASNRSSLKQLQLQALDAFYSVLTARARLDVLTASIKRQSETVAFMESNFKMGAGMRSSVLLAVSAFKALEPEQIRARRDAEVTAMMLNRLLGRPVAETLELDTTEIPAWAAGSDLPQSEIQTVLDRRDDLAALRLQKEALRGYARVSRMAYLPSLGFQGKWGILAYDPDQLGAFDDNLEWQVGVGLQWPLFDGMGANARARQYDSDARSLELTERQAKAFAQIEIESAQREAAAADTAYEAARQARAAAAEALELLSEDFRAGKGQVTDLLAAEEGLRNAEFGILAARTQRVRSRAGLRVALGMDLIAKEAE